MTRRPCLLVAHNCGPNPATKCLKVPVLPEYQAVTGYLVDLTAEESNLLFQVLEEWERHLAHLDLDGLERDHDETDT